MPFVNALLAAEHSPDLTARVVTALTNLTAEVLHKERPRTTVVVQYVPETRWARGGVIYTRGFHIEAKITSGTNSRADKARYVAEVNDALEALLGAPGYVVVSEIAPESWGYGGETQEARYSARLQV